MNLTEVRQFMMVALRLAWSPDSQQRWRQLSVSLGALVLAIAMGFSISMVLAGAAADQRDLDRRAIWAGDDPHPPLWISVRGEIWDGRQFPVIWLYGDEDSPLPPGLAELPAPGHVVASPAIANRPDVVAALGLQVAPSGTGAGGTIGEEGLLAASEWRLYASPPKGRSLGEGGALIPVSDFGGPAEVGMSFDTDRAAPSRDGSTLAMWTLLMFPALILAWSCARARSELRVSRAQSLYRIGFGPVTLRLFGTLETAALAVPGAVVGVLLSATVLQHVRSLPLTGLMLNSRALVLPAWMWPVILVAVVLLMTVLGSVSSVTELDGAHRRVGAHRDPSWLRGMPLTLGLGVMIVSKGFIGATGVLLMVVGMVVTLLALPFALPLLVRHTGLFIARARRPAAWFAGHRMAQSSHRLGAPAVVLGVLIFILGGGTGVVSATTTTFSSHLSGAEIFALDWRDAKKSDLTRITERIPQALVMPVVADTVYATSCDHVAQLIARSAPTCDAAALTARASELLGRRVMIGDPGPEVVVDQVIIGGNAELANVDIWAATNSLLPAVNLSTVSGTPYLRAPLLVSWILAGMLAAGTVLAAAAAHTFGNRLFALGREDNQLLRVGLDAEQVRSVQRWTALAPLAPAIGVGFIGATIFSWTGVPHEVTSFPVLIIAGETAIIALIAAGVALVVGILQRRQHASVR